MMKKPISPGGLAATVALGTPLLVWGCLSDTQVYDIQEAHRPALHCVHAQRLAATMADINKNYRKAHRLPIRVMRDQQFRTLEHCAEQIATYAASLPESANLGELTPANRAVFETLALQLRENAEALKGSAAKKDSVGTRENFARLTSTCNSCHAAFRQSIAGNAHGETK